MVFVVYKMRAGKIHILKYIGKPPKLKKLSKKQQIEYNELLEVIGLNFELTLKDMTQKGGRMAKKKKKKGGGCSK